MTNGNRDASGDNRPEEIRGAMERVRDVLEEESGRFTKTCEVCTQPLREEGEPGEEIGIVVDSTNSFREWASWVSFYCPKHAPDPQSVTSDLLTAKAVVFRATVNPDEGSMNVHDYEHHDATGRL